LRTPERRAPSVVLRSVGRLELSRPPSHACRFPTRLHVFLVVRFEEVGTQNEFVGLLRATCCFNKKTPVI
jgi:hypothetical protein